ncbi:unnamed protein product [Cuscuta europaea]|uniref:Uncharacterized protein n=1 Tax=Cuscuta europaea TaxID=41803 RepID=A0A9P1E783_CUSEU|nr:unnamed protein product [Cuscuta europaea]
MGKTLALSIRCLREIPRLLHVSYPGTSYHLLGGAGNIVQLRSLSSLLVSIVCVKKHDHMCYISCRYFFVHVIVLLVYHLQFPCPLRLAISGSCASCLICEEK